MTLTLAANSTKRGIPSADRSWAKYHATPCNVVRQLKTVQQDLINFDSKETGTLNRVRTEESSFELDTQYSAKYSQ